MVQGGIQVTVCLIVNTGLIVFERGVLWSRVGGRWGGGVARTCMRGVLPCSYLQLSCNVASL